MSKFHTREDVLKFIRGGNAVFTIKSLKTGKHFTYKVAQKQVEDHDGKMIRTGQFFVRVLAGPDNQDWAASQYIGFMKSFWAADYLREGKDPLIAGKKGKKNAPSFIALQWVLKKLSTPTDIDCIDDWSVEIMHEGRCCRCNRALTHPDSIKTGVGPECAKHFC
jgi:hypothetical protein